MPSTLILISANQRVEMVEAEVVVVEVEVATAILQTIMVVGEGHIRAQIRD